MRRFYRITKWITWKIFIVTFLSSRSCFLFCCCCCCPYSVYSVVIGNIVICCCRPLHSYREYLVCYWHSFIQNIYPLWPIYNVIWMDFDENPLIARIGKFTMLQVFFFAFHTKLQYNWRQYPEMVRQYTMSVFWANKIQTPYCHRDPKDKVNNLGSAIQKISPLLPLSLSTVFRLCSRQR